MRASACARVRVCVRSRGCLSRARIDCRSSVYTPLSSTQLYITNAAEDIVKVRRGCLNMWATLTQSDLV